MKVDVYTIVIVLIYLFITAYLAYLGYKNTKNSQDYLIAGRGTHPLIMALSYGATFISTAAIVGFGGLAANMGMGLLWLTVLNVFMGIFIAFIVFGKRTRKMGHTLDAHTFPELLSKRYDSKFMQVFAGALIFLFMPIYAAAVIKGGANFVQEYFGIDYKFSLLIFVLIVAAYVWVGGLKGVMYTDAFQGLIMFVAMATLLIVAYVNLGGITTAHVKLTNLFHDPSVQETLKASIGKGFQGWTSMPKFNSALWWSLVSTVVTGVGIGVLAQPQLVVRFMTVKSNKELNRAVLSGGIFILMMTGVAFIVGALSNVLFFENASIGKIAVAAAKSTDSIIPMFIKQYLPGWFSGIFLISMLAAAMSTLSSQFHAMGTAAGRDIYERGFGKKGNTLLITRSGIIVVIIISTVLAWVGSDIKVADGIINKFTTMFFELTSAAFLPAFVGALYFKGIPRAAAKWGMVAGSITWFVWTFFIHSNAAVMQLCKALTGKDTLVADTSLKNLSQIGTTFVALPVAIIVTLVIWAIYSANKKKDLTQAHIEKCFKGI